MKTNKEITKSIEATGLPLNNRITSLKGLWRLLMYQYESTTIDPDVLVRYVNKVASVLRLEVWKVYGAMYQHFDFSGRLPEESKVVFLKRTGQIREAVAKLLEAYSYEIVSAKRLTLRRAVKRATQKQKKVKITMQYSSAKDLAKTLRKLARGFEKSPIFSKAEYPDILELSMYP